jgi:hypothetical protein
MPSGKRWVGTWAAAPAPAEGVVGFNNQTIRLNPRFSIGGERLRMRIRDLRLCGQTATDLEIRVYSAPAQYPSSQRAPIMCLVPATVGG